MRVRVPLLQHCIVMILIFRTCNNGQNDLASSPPFNYGQLRHSSVLFRSTTFAVLPKLFLNFKCCEAVSKLSPFLSYFKDLFNFWQKKILINLISTSLILAKQENPFCFYKTTPVSRVKQPK